MLPSWLERYELAPAWRHKRARCLGFCCRGALGASLGVSQGPGTEDAVRGSAILLTLPPAFPLPLVAGWGAQAWVRSLRFEVLGPRIIHARSPDMSSLKLSQKAHSLEGSSEVVPSLETRPTKPPLPWSFLKFCSGPKFASWWRAGRWGCKQVSTLRSEIQVFCFILLLIHIDLDF